MVLYNRSTRGIVTKMRNAKHVEFQTGDWVRVRKPGILVKGHVRYTNPVKIAKKLSPYTYELSDGKRWNINKLIPTQPCIDIDQPLDDFDLESLNGEMKPQGKDQLNPNENVTAMAPKLRRSSRQRRQPSLFKDFVMY